VGGGGGGKMLIKIKFEGGLAKQHKIPAYDGITSLEGLTRSMLIMTNFLVEGKVRRKKFGGRPFAFNLIAQRPGSFESVYEILYETAAIGGPLIYSLSAGIAGNLLTDLMKVVYSRALGNADRSISDRVRNLELERGGDIAALVDAIEPSIRLGHNVINNGVIHINMYSSNSEKQDKITSLDDYTKKYVLTNIENNNIRVKIFSIASFNANQGTGRAFDINEGRSIPFELDKSVDRSSIDTIIKSIGSYAKTKRLGDPLLSAVAIKYTSIESADLRTKKICILSVRQEIQDLVT